MIWKSENFKHRLSVRNARSSIGNNQTSPLVAISPATLDMNDQNRDAKRLLEKHRLHLGLYARLSKKLQVTPSYISHVANGKRNNPKIMAALLAELRKLEQ